MLMASASFTLFKLSLVVAVLLLSGSHQAPQQIVYPAFYTAAPDYGYYAAARQLFGGNGLFGGALIATRFATTTITFTYTYSTTCSKKAANIAQCANNALPYAANFLRSLPDDDDAVSIDPSQVSSNTVEATQLAEANAIIDNNHQQQKELTGDYAMIYPGYYVALEPSMAYADESNNGPASASTTNGAALLMMRQLLRRTVTITFIASTTTVSTSTRTVTQSCTLANNEPALFPACP